MWDRTKEQSFRLDAAPLNRGSVAFDPTGKLLAMAESNGLVSLWRLETGERIAQVTAFGEGSWAVVAAAGRYDASGPGNMPAQCRVMPDAPDVAVRCIVFTISATFHLTAFFRPQFPFAQRQCQTATTLWKHDA